VIFLPSRGSTGYSSGDPLGPSAVAPFDFARAVANPDWVSTSDADALEELRAVEPGWRMRTLTRLRPRAIDGKAVLVRRPWWFTTRSA
jgi:hypothetical protein